MVSFPLMYHDQEFCAFYFGAGASRCRALPDSLTMLTDLCRAESQAPRPQTTEGWRREIDTPDADDAGCAGKEDTQYSFTMVIFLMADAKITAKPIGTRALGEPSSSMKRGKVALVPASVVPGAPLSQGSPSAHPLWQKPKALLEDLAWCCISHLLRDGVWLQDVYMTSRILSWAQRSFPFLSFPSRSISEFWLLALSRAPQHMGHVGFVCGRNLRASSARDLSLAPARGIFLESALESKNRF